MSLLTRNLPPSPMWQRLRNTVRELLGVVPTLDLHGYSVREAIDETARFLRHAQALGAPVVRIVYGKGHGSPAGKGVLREAIPQWLESHTVDLVDRFERLPDASGADGSAKVWLKSGKP